MSDIIHRTLPSGTLISCYASKAIPSEQDRVRQFMEGVQEANQSPTFPSKATLDLRDRLIMEELTEYRQAVDDGDIVAVADALTDLIYVVKGAAVAFGIDLEACFDEVHRSNMTKRWDDGQFHKDERGKIIKPPSYEPPDLKKVLLRQ